MTRPTTMIDEADLRPPWDVWLTVAGVPTRTVPTWEVNVGEALAGPRGITRLPRLWWTRLRWLVLGPQMAYAQRAELEQCFYPGDRAALGRVSDAEVTMLTLQYAAAESAWCDAYRQALEAAYLRLMRPPASAPGRTVTTSAQLADALAGVPGVRAGGRV